MKSTDLSTPNHFHKVVDCQWACPAHTPVPQYIRLIAEGRYAAAYMVNWEANVFPGILGRTCDRPCEPACRRGRVEKEPVAICRLKRAAADFEQRMIVVALDAARGVQKDAARILGVKPTTLNEMLKRHRMIAPRKGRPSGEALEADETDEGTDEPTH